MSSAGHLILFIYRISISLLMMPHGLNKWNKLMAGGEIKFYDFAGLGNANTLGIAIITECFAPVCIILGWWTRLWSATVCITMLVAALLVHAGDPLEDRESSLCYFFLFLILVWQGPGRWSLEGFLTRRNSPK
jgi:putative oxidoreductase